MERIVEAIRRNGSCGCFANDDNVHLMDITLTVAVVDLGLGYQFYLTTGQQIPWTLVTSEMVERVDAMLGRNQS